MKGLEKLYDLRKILKKHDCYEFIEKYLIDYIETELKALEIIARELEIKIDIEYACDDSREKKYSLRSDRWGWVSIDHHSYNTVSKALKNGD